MINELINNISMRLNNFVNIGTSFELMNPFCILGMCIK